jgi:hypothetical protein
MRPQYSIFSGFVACMASGAATARPDLLWIEQFGTVARDAASAIVPDGAGGVILGGLTSGDLGGPNAGPPDAFLARHDGAGVQGWVVQFGTDAEEYVAGLTPDGAGGVFAAGYTKGSLAGPNVGGYDAFLARYDSAGTQMWIKQFGTSGYDFAHALASDGAGGAFIVGFTEGSLGGPNAGSWDIFLARYNGAGDQSWITQFGTSEDEYDSALAPDGTGGAFVAGITHGSLGGPNAGGYDVFLARFNSAGDQGWITQFGSDKTDYAHALASDGLEGVFVAGSTDGSLGGPNAGGRDAYLARHDGSGTQMWMTQFGTAEGDFALALSPDGPGVFVAGSTKGALGGPGAGDFDVFLARHDNAGKQTWITQFGTAEYDSAGSLAPDGDAGVVIAGSTDGSLGGPSAGDRDFFVARFGPDCYPDLDASGSLDLFDFLAFTNLFNAEDPAADCAADGTFDLFDFLCFVNQFNAGC